MLDRKVIIDVAKKCIYEPADEKKCENCPYSKFSTATDDCWFHLMGDMIFLLDGGTPAVVDEGKYFYIWVYEEKTWKEVTKEEYENLKDEEYGRHGKKEEKDD